MQPTNNRREHHGVYSGHKGVPPRPATSRPGRRWRENYECRPHKGSHEYELVFPDRIGRRFVRTTPEEYYRQEFERGKEQEKKGQMFHRTYKYYRCKHCGHKKLERMLSL